MAGSEVRTNRLMWFAAGAATMALYLMGPHAIYNKGYGLARSAAVWIQTR